MKFVVADEADYRWACEVIREHELGGRTEVLLSPVHGRLDPKNLVGWMLRDRLPARLNLQLHKYVWEPETRAALMSRSSCEKSRALIGESGQRSWISYFD